MMNLNAIAPTHILILGLLLSILMAGLLFKFRVRKTAFPHQPRESISARRLLIGFLRLAGFGVMALFLIIGALMFYEDYHAMKSETAPAFHSVDLPAGATLAVQEVSFAGANGNQMAGWYVPSTNGATIILLHGYGGTRADMLWHAETLVHAGYGALLYDEHASGESTGTRRSYGWEDAPDIGGAIQFIKERNGEKSTQTDRIGISGCSVGGQIALQGAILYPEIAAVWADGPANIRAADSPAPTNIIDGLVLISNYLIDFLYEQELRISAPPPLIDRINHIAPRPVMLVGGGVKLGLMGSEAQRVERFADFAGPNAQVWIIEDAVHCDGPTKQPQQYAQRLVQFFDTAFADFGSQ